MPAISVYLLVYGISMIGMGIHGFTTGSVVSLIAAGSVGMIIIGTVALHKSNPRPARIIAAVVSLLTLLMEGKSYMFPKPKAGEVVVASAPIERHIYPHGLAAVLSLVSVVVLGGGHVVASRGRSGGNEQG